MSMTTLVVWALLGQEFVTPLGKVGNATADTPELKAAVAALAEKPNDTERMLAAARAYDRVLKFSESIPLYTQVIAALPGDVRAYRYRGHRLISTRKFREAIRDLKRAEQIAPGSFDVLYHLALAEYLNGEYKSAARTYARCLDWKAGTSAGSMPSDWRSCEGLNDDSRVAMLNWRYAALRRAGQTADAARLLAGVSERMEVKENVAYHQALLYYRGERGDEIFEGARLTGSSLMAAGYPVANFALMEGNKDKACQLFRKITSTDNWAAFGYIAAEAELVKGTCPR